MARSSGSSAGPANKAERLLQVVLCLTQSRRYVTKDQLRHAIPDYEACPTTEAFERMFERDKNELREMGIPLETGPAGMATLADDDPGYRIDHDTYALPPLHLTRDELTAVGLAARVWQEQGPASAAARALLKLEADTPPDGQRHGLPAIEPRLSGGEAAFTPLTLAVTARRPVCFPYQGPRDEQPRDRHVEPWGVVSLRGRWYVVGFDRDRAAERVFRLSRIVGAVVDDGADAAFDVPAGIDLRSRVDGFAGARPTSTAVLRVRTGSGYGLRRRAASVRPAGRDDPDADVVTVEYGDTQALAEEISGYGASIRVDGPDELRQAVVGRLRAALAGAGGDAAPDGDTA
jgi:proteasome accessory factor B